MTATHNITILGSTGSVGQNTLAVIEAHPAYNVYALTAHRNIGLLLTQKAFGLSKPVSGLHGLKNGTPSAKSTTTRLKLHGT